MTMADKWGRPLKDKNYGMDPKDVNPDHADVANPAHHHEDGLPDAVKEQLAKYRAEATAEA